jgi:hypothetical protein
MRSATTEPHSSAFAAAQPARSIPRRRLLDPEARLLEAPTQPDEERDVPHDLQRQSRSVGKGEAHRGPHVVVLEIEALDPTLLSGP